MEVEVFEFEFSIGEVEDEMVVFLVKRVLFLGALVVGDGEMGGGECDGQESVRELDLKGVLRVD